VPFYDYVCQACGRRIEVMHGVHATGPERCDACGGRMQRVISRPAIHFKGSGWAKVDAKGHSPSSGRSHGSGGAGGTDDTAGDGATKDEPPTKPASGGGGSDEASAAEAAPRAASRSRGRNEA